MTPHDDERLRALYRAGTLEEPPPHVDRQIRDAARRHAPRRHRGWIPALATAAVLVLAVAVVIRVPDEQGRQSDRTAPGPAEESVPASPAIGSRARTSLPEDAPAPEKPRKAEQPPAARFEHRASPAPTEPAETPSSRDASPASAGRAAVDAAREPADAADHESVDERRLKTGRGDCQPPEAMLTEDRATLLARIGELEQQGRLEEAECLRLWLENSPPH